MTFLKFYKGSSYFTQSLIRDSNHCGILNAWVGQEEVFYLRWGDLTN